MIGLISDKIWEAKLCGEFRKPYFKLLEEFVENERSLYTIYPSIDNTFAALNLTPLKEVKVVILGQDPYHAPHQAHGLSFSVNNGIKPPPSLANIFKELRTDLGCAIPAHGNLTNWAKQGVLLLNSTLSVRAGEPGSHQKKGWEIFTDQIITLVSNEQKHCVFMLWGNSARTKAALIDSNKHLILEAAHPSPLARGAFFGCRHFSQANSYLASKNIETIHWDLSSNDLFKTTG